MQCVYVLVRRTHSVAVPIEIDALGPKAVTAWLRDHGFPDIQDEREWRVDYARLLQSPSET